MRSGLRQLSTQTGSEKTSAGAASGVGPPHETSTSSTTFRYSRASTDANDELSVTERREQCQWEVGVLGPVATIHIVRRGLCVHVSGVTLT